MREEEKQPQLPDDKAYQKLYGIGINLAIGKEWWVSDNWGLGVAAQLSSTVLPDKNLRTGEELNLTTHSVGILFSATFN